MATPAAERSQAIYSSCAHGSAAEKPAAPARLALWPVSLLLKRLCVRPEVQIPCGVHALQA